MRANHRRKTSTRPAKLSRSRNLASGAGSRQAQPRRRKLVTSRDPAGSPNADILERISEAFVALDADWRFTYVNERAAQIFGRRREDFIGKHIWTEFPEGIGQPFYKAYYRAVETQEPIHLEEYYPLYDRWFENRIYPSPNGLTIFIQDVTEQKHTEEAIRQSEKRFSQVFHASPVATSITSLKDGSYVDANEAWQRMFGYTRDEILGSSSLKLGIWVHPEEREGMIRQLEATGSLRNFEHLARTKAGDVRDVLVSAEVIELNDERYNLSLVIDITERKRVEQALAASEKRLALIFDTASDVLFLIAVEGHDTFRFISVNPAFLAVTGLAPEQVVGKRMEQVLPASAHALVLAKYRQAIREKRTVRWEEVSAYPTGTLYGEVAVTPAWNDEGQCTHLIGSVHDITEIRRAEERVRQLNVDLEAKVAERTAQLQSANKELEAFSYSVSHDLRAPLRAISGFAEIVARRHRADLNEEGRHYVDNIVQASERMGRLIDDLLTLARLGRQAVRHEPVPLQTVFDPLGRDRAPQLVHIGGTLEIADDLPIVIGDKTLLNQIFANLLDNAITYRRRDVPVRVSVTWESQDRDVVIRVSDNGIGISSEYYEKIFSIFQRLHSDDEYPGTGIGLATVKKSVELLGGQVWVESAEQEGSTFTVRLPRSAA